MKKLSDILKQQYGEKIFKICLTSGCTCPNRDGKISLGGCSFCSEGGSGEFASAPGDIDTQIEEAKERIRNKTSASRYIAYFQSFTNTYGDVETLEKLYERVIRRKDIVILSIGTRPDCLGEDVLEMLRRLNEIKPVWIELGLEDMLQTIRYLAALSPGPDGIKLQMLNILRGTELGRQYEENPFPLLSLEEYTDIAAESISILPEEMVIHRMTGDGPGNILIAPDWVRNKKKVLNTISRKLKEKNEVSFTNKC